MKFYLKGAIVAVLTLFFLSLKILWVKKWSHIFDVMQNRVAIIILKTCFSILNENCPTLKG